jgi:hypothetical protein
MSKPFVVPTITTRRVVTHSLDEIKKSLGGPNYVRVGLPDSTTATTPNRKARKAAAKKGKP